MCDVNKSVISLTEHHCQDVMREKGAGWGVGRYSIMGTIPPGFFFNEELFEDNTIEFKFNFI